MAQSDEAALLVRMEASLAKFEKQMQAGYAAADKYSNQIETRFGAMGKKTAKSAEVSASAMVKELDNLRARYDPLFAASKRYEDELDQVNRAWKLGAITAAQHGAAVERLNGQYLSVQAATADLGDAALRGGDKMRMAAMQLSQVGQQTMATGNFVQALAIQLPDLGLAFGTVGAAAGLLGGIALPMLWSAISGSGEEAAAAAEKTDRLKAAYDGVAESARGTQVEIDRLRFGVDDEYQVELLQEQIRLRAEYNLKAAELNAYLATTTDSLDRQRIASADMVAEVGAIAEKYNQNSALLADQEVKATQLAIIEGQRAQAAGEAAARVEEAAAATERQESAMIAAYESYANTREEADLLAEAAADAGVAASDLADVSFGNISGAATEALRLAGNLGIALGNAQALAALGPQGIGGNDPSGQTYSGRGRAPTQSEIVEMRVAGTFGYTTPPKDSGRGGSGRKGGGGSDKEDESIFKTSEADIQRIQREIELLGRSAGEVAKLKAEWALLDVAKKRGLDLDKVQAGTSRTLREEIEAQAQAVADLTVQLERQKLAYDQFEKGIDGIADAMSQALVNGKSLREGLADVFRGIALDLAKSGIREGLMSLLKPGSSGGGGGFLGSILGGLFGGNSSGTGTLGLPSNANGTDNFAGGLTRVNERGGEIMNLPRGTQIIPHDISKRMADRSGGGMVEILLRQEPGVVAEIARNEAGAVIRRAAPGLVQESVKATYRTAEEHPIGRRR